MTALVFFEEPARREYSSDCPMGRLLSPRRIPLGSVQPVVAPGFRRFWAAFSQESSEPLLIHETRLFEADGKPWKGRTVQPEGLA